MTPSGSFIDTYSFKHRVWKKVSLPAPTSFVVLGCHVTKCRTAKEADAGKKCNLNICPLGSIHTMVFQIAGGIGVILPSILLSILNHRKPRDACAIPVTFNGTQIAAGFCRYSCMTNCGKVTQTESRDACGPKEVQENPEHHGVNGA